MKVDIKELNKLVEERLLTCRTNGDLFIYNYTPNCQFDNKWSELTMMARGLITTKDGLIIARPFPKFFNLNQTDKVNIKNLPTYQPEVSEKMDGSLGILYKKTNDNNYYIATRGSFDSEQAIWATNWLRSKEKNKIDFLNDITYLFEIIYPLNRIVVNYGNRAELVMIGMVHKETGVIFSYKEVVQEAKRLEFNYPKLFSMSLNEIQEKTKNSKENEEGFVLLWNKEQLMVKIKLEDYIRLHRLTFGISVKSIWENMAQGKDIKEVFKDVPDEIYEWVKNWEQHFKKEEKKHLNKVKKYLDIIKKFKTRKEQALYIEKNARKYLSVLFFIIDKRDYMFLIYKFFKPTAKESTQTFKYIKEDL